MKGQWGQNGRIIQTQMKGSGEAHISGYFQLHNLLPMKSNWCSYQSQIEETMAKGVRVRVESQRR